MGTALATFAVFLSLVILVLGAASIGLYVLGSIGLYTMAKNRGSHHAWFAWVPVLRGYLLGEVTGNRMWGFDGSKWILSLGPVALTLLSMTVVGLVITFPLSIAFVVYYFMVLFKLYKMYQPRNAELYLITSIVFEFMVPIWFFLIRNNVPDMNVLREDRQGPQRQVEPDPQDLYGDIEYRQNNSYLNYTEDVREETAPAPYQHVRDALASLRMQETPDIQKETITIKAMDNDKMDEIVDRVSDITESLEDFINDKNGASDFDLSPEPKESEKIELYFGDEPEKSE